MLFVFQGLANLYEKTDQWDFKAELPDVYQKLVELYARWAPIMRKAFLRTLPRSTKRTLDLTISLLFSWFIWLFKCFFLFLFFLFALAARLINNKYLVM